MSPRLNFLAMPLVGRDQYFRGHIIVLDNSLRNKFESQTEHYPLVAAENDNT